MGVGEKAFELCMGILRAVRHYDSYDLFIVKLDTFLLILKTSGD
jgi:hypothetical protein